MAMGELTSSEARAQYDSKKRLIVEDAQGSASSVGSAINGHRRRGRDTVKRTRAEDGVSSQMTSSCAFPSSCPMNV